MLFFICFSYVFHMFNACFYLMKSVTAEAEELIHTESGLISAGTVERHHFHLHHGDHVRVEIEETNGAEASTSAISDGYTVDLTEPVLIKLVDGDDVNNDIQYTVCTNLLRLKIRDQFPYYLKKVI